MSLRLPKTRPGRSSRLDDAVCAYLECALWSSTIYTEDPGDERADQPFDSYFGVGDFDDFEVIKATSDVARFIAENYDDCQAAAGGLHAWGQIGHDLWLTRNGHGAGFWDRGLGDIGERLSDAARSYGEILVFLDTTDGDTLIIE
jgi:hypothetical protein